MPNLQGWMWIAALFVLALLLRALGRGEGALPYFSKEFLLTRGEFAFYDMLRRSLPPNVAIAMKVRLADVIGCSGEAWKQGHGGRISQKHLDFVLYDITTTRILAAIELDDQSHQRADRIARDAFLERAMSTAGVPLLRVPAAANYDARRLRDVVAARCAGTPTG